MSGGRESLTDLVPGCAEGEASYAEIINADILLPTGMILTLTCRQTSTLTEMKNTVWKKARSYPLFDRLKDPGFYSFIGILKDGNKDEFVNESQSIGDLNLFTPLLKLEERQGNLEEKRLKSVIGTLIGRKLADFDVMETEVQDCRRHWLDECEAAIYERQKTQDSLIHYKFSAVLVSENDPSVTSVQEKAKDYVDFVIFYFDTRGQANQLIVQARPSITPAELAAIAYSAPDVYKAYRVYSARDFRLKVVGKEEYLLDDVPLYRFKHIAECLVRSIQCKLTLALYEELTDVHMDHFVRPVHGKNIPRFRASNIMFNPFELSQGTIGRSPNTYLSTWNIKQTYKLKVLSAKHCNIQDTMKVYVRAALYHGDQTLCPVVSTMKGVHPDRPEWNETLEFVVPVTELPRSAKICFLIFQQKQAGGRKRKEGGPLAWVNMNVFDYAGRLQEGKKMLYAWAVFDQHELNDQVNYIGSTVLNPNHDACIQLSIEIPTQSQNNAPVMFPSAEEVECFANEMAEGATQSSEISDREHRELKRLIEQDPLDELDELGKDTIWKARNLCAEKFPTALPKVLQSVTWNNRSDVAQVYSLLLKWPSIPPENALELLHYKYADIAVRMWAVECLEELSDDQLLMYLLQLVQVLKFEPYLDCPLAEFLLKRGLRNKTVGHYLFWYLRAEMHLPAVSVRYGLMLEAYCWGCGEYRDELAVQVEALAKLKRMSGELGKIRRAKSEDLKDYCSQNPQFLRYMAGLQSPLNPLLHAKKLNIEKCKVLDSKTKPVWLNFENLDPLGDNILHIFKNGDDLRQDMLTLQILSIIDSMWREAGFDLRMKPYQCLSVGEHVGLIEVVTDTSTIAKIQERQGSRGVFDKKLLYQWLKEKNKTPSKLDKAIETFTFSCAGCCVATYVLGIGDRHSDNILLRENGQLVHIDFGHFLGNFKSKFGVKREWVPFVLTDDFIYIITHEKNKDAPEFIRFTELCEKIFLVLRRHGDLIINLFTMMLCTGIPELRSTDDIRYISKALCLAKTKEQALENFRKKMREAVKHSWSVSVNWYFHNMAHAGKKY